MNMAMKNVKQSNFLIRYLNECFDKYTPSELSILLGIDEEILTMIYHVLVTDELSGEDITISYIIAMYESGFNYQEIGFLKDISKMGVRHHLKMNLMDKELSHLKLKNKSNRVNIKDIIFRIEVIKILNDDNYEDIRKELGYSESYFKLLVENSNRKFRGRG